MLKIIHTTLFILTVCFSNAQDAFFSQFYLTPQILNPALCGYFDGQHRVTANHRNQWAQLLGKESFRTYSISYDNNTSFNNDDLFGYGGIVSSDRAGSGEYGYIKGTLMGSFVKKIEENRNKSFYLTAGAEIGVQQLSFDLTRLEWENQFDYETNEFSSSLPSYEEFSSHSKIFPDLSAGISIYADLENENEFHIGLAISHLNTPNLSFKENDKSLLLRRWTIHAGGQIDLSRQFNFFPSIVFFKQGASFMFNPGFETRLSFNGHSSNSNYHVGLWGRVSNRFNDNLSLDAIILSLRFLTPQFSFGLSYDLNSSTTVSAIEGGAFEISLSYVFQEQAANFSIECPKF